MYHDQSSPEQIDFKTASEDPAAEHIPGLIQTCPKIALIHEDKYFDEKRSRIHDPVFVDFVILIQIVFFPAIPCFGI